MRIGKTEKFSSKGSWRTKSLSAYNDYFKRKYTVLGHNYRCTERPLLSRYSCCCCWSPLHSPSRHLPINQSINQSILQVTKSKCLPVLSHGYRSVSTNCIGLACTGLRCKQIFHEIIYYECNGYGKNLPCRIILILICQAALLRNGERLL